MSVLDAFLSTWSHVRSTFGDGTPQTGAQLDKSGTLRQLESGLASAAPGSRWTGAAASAYDTANAEHRRVLGQLAGLDQRLSAHVDQSAQVVAAGRLQLDEVRKWVVDAASSAPQGSAGERMLLPIVQKGIGQVIEVVQRSNGDLNTIGTAIRGLGEAYQALSNQKFGAKEGPELAGADERQDDDPRKKAEQDVQDALAGDQGAAKRVEDVLSSIEPGQELTAEQGSYLSQMQAQQHGMSVDELATAERRLGEHKDIIADSWQLMSNDDIRFPRTETEVGALDDRKDRVKGAFDQLPQSVQDTLRNAGDLWAERGAADLAHASDLNKISGIVKDGNVEFQTGTELDREMMRAADTVMDRYGDRVPVGDVSSVAEGIFESAGRDQQIVHDHLLGTHGDDGDDFLHDVNQIVWSDDGKAAAGLFSWTNESHVGPEADIASATAEKYATYIGSHKDELMQLSDPFGDKTLGQVNPELVKGYAHGLTPFMADIASVTSTNPNDNFGTLDPGNPDRPIAKGLFAVLGTHQDAYVEFNGAADQLGLERAHQYAEDVKNGIPAQCS